MPSSALHDLIVTLSGDCEIALERAFHAPASLLFEAHTNCAHLRRWWGPRALELSVCEIDLRVGGAYRLVHRDVDGREYGFRGEYREIVPPARLIYTQRFEEASLSGRQSIVTVSFGEENG